MAKSVGAISQHDRQTNDLKDGVVIFQHKPDENDKKAPLDNKNRGRYFVYVFGESVNKTESEDHDNGGGSFRARNHVNRYRLTPSRARRKKDNKENFGSGLYGSYYPLQPGTLIKAEYRNNQKNDIDIVEIVSDQEFDGQNDNCVPFGMGTEDRDELYLTLRTPKWDNIFCLTEETVTEPMDSYHFYYNIENEDSVADNERFGGTDEETGPKTAIRTKLIVNASEYNTSDKVENGGIHFFTHDNFYSTIDEEFHFAVNRNSFINNREDEYVHFRAFGKQNVFQMTVDQSIDFYQQRHDEDYNKDAGGSLPADNKKPDRKDRDGEDEKVNKYLKATFDSDIDIHVTENSKFQNIRAKFDTTLDWKILKWIKTWFFDKVDSIIENFVTIWLKDRLDLTIDKFVRIWIKDQFDLTVEKAVKIWLKDTFDFILDKRMDAHLRDIVNILIDKDARIHMQEKLDATVVKPVTTWLKETVDINMDKNVKMTCKKDADIMTEGQMTAEFRGETGILANDKLFVEGKQSTDMVLREDVKIHAKNKLDTYVKDSTRMTFVKPLDIAAAETITMETTNKIGLLAKDSVTAEIKSNLDTIVHPDSRIQFKDKFDFSASKEAKFTFKDLLHFMAKEKAIIEFKDKLDVLINETVNARLDKELNILVKEAVDIKLKKELSIVSKEPIVIFSEKSIVLKTPFNTISV